MSPFGETRSFTAACVCDREREGILDCRPSTNFSGEMGGERAEETKTNTPQGVLQLHPIFLLPFKAHIFKACL